MTNSIGAYTQLQNMLHEWQVTRQTVALVPTMGAIHAGHLQLVAEAKKNASKIVVSIFVNPAQFGPNEDFANYPRTLERDIQLLAQAGVDLVWSPSVGEMYPEGFATSIHVAGLREALCGAFRPGHFDGVATVVAKLFMQIRPDIALFGEKDYQQLMLIKRLVKDLNMNIEVLGVPTLRERDGLALSSRNQYLDADERKIAPKLYAILQQTSNHIRSGADVKDMLGLAEKEIIAAGFTKIDYIELREEESLMPVVNFSEETARLLSAVWLGKTRLIDNVRVAIGK
ncbi:MAG: pantoate--beta-alanine ligase [Alphaproteobacteria bacterium]|jgi:pantoate--beta-alanine ligase